MSVESCIEKLVKVGRVSRRQADEALGYYQLALTGNEGFMGRASAEAKAALDMAEIMLKATADKKNALAMQAINQTKALERVKAHKKGALAGTMDLLTPDIWRASQGANVETLTETLQANLMRRFNTGLEKYRSTAFGLKQDLAGIEKMVREMLGEQTGDAGAKAAARGWKDAVDYADKRASAAGIVFHQREDYLPQHWETSRVKSRQAALRGELMDALRTGDVTMIDPKTHQEIAWADAGNAVDAVVRNIAYGLGGSDSSTGIGRRAFNGEARVVRFNNADAYLRFMKEYGPGPGGMMHMLSGHLGSSAREIALAEVLGPQHKATMAEVMRLAKQDESKGIARKALLLGMESTQAVERTYKYLTGALDGVQSEAVASAFGALRSIHTAASLGSAIISAIPGDTVLMALTAADNGISPVSVMKRIVTEIANDGKQGRELASRLNIIAHSSMDQAIGVRRFDDQVIGRDTAGKLATTVIRASGLSYWTDIAKRAFTMEFLGLVTDQSRFGFDALDKNFRGFLQRHGMDAADWEKLRPTPGMKIEDATFFDLGQVQDRALGERLMSAIIDERLAAVLEPTARVRQLTSGGLVRGTMAGEIARSTFLYKSFAMSVILTHIMRIVTADSLGSAAMRAVPFILFTTLAGALSLQVKQLIAGKDARPMDDKAFWGAAFAQGGASSIYGDFLYSSISRADSSLATTLAGPVAQMGDDVLKLVSKGMRGDDTTGAQLSKMFRRYTPGSSLWYTRLAVDRLIWDKTQEMIDPQYRQSFRRMQDSLKKNYDQSYWFKPGTNTPQRAPRLLP